MLSEHQGTSYLDGFVSLTKSLLLLGFKSLNEKTAGGHTSGILSEIKGKSRPIKFARQMHSIDQNQKDINNLFGKGE